MVEPDLAKLVDDDGAVCHAVMTQQLIEQCRFAAAEKAGDQETGRRDADLSMSNNPMRVPKMPQYAAGAEPAAQDRRCPPVQPTLVPARQSNYHSIC